jgi:hypothetical protein
MIDLIETDFFNINQFIPNESFFRLPICYTFDTVETYPSIYMIGTTQTRLSRLYVATLVTKNISSGFFNSEINAITLSNFVPIDEFANGNSVKVTLELTQIINMVDKQIREFWEFRTVTSTVIDTSKLCWSIILTGRTCGGFDLFTTIKYNSILIDYELSPINILENMGGASAMVLVWRPWW